MESSPHRHATYTAQVRCLQAVVPSCSQLDDRIKPKWRTLSKPRLYRWPRIERRRITSARSLSASLISSVSAFDVGLSGNSATSSFACKRRTANFQIRRAPLNREIMQNNPKAKVTKKSGVMNACLFVPTEYPVTRVQD